MVHRPGNRNRRGSRVIGRAWPLAAFVLLLVGLSAAGRAEVGTALDRYLERYPDLYTARVAVERPGEVSAVLGPAMRSMLVRLTGLRRPEDHPGVAAGLADPERFVQQYRFESDRGGGLAVRFDEAAVDEFVDRLGLGRWSRVRPRLVIWLAVEDERGRKRYADPASEAAAALEAPASERGVPFIVPLFDIEDRVAVPVSTLWGGFPEPLERASARYAADAILAGRIRRDEAGRWQARWTLFGDPGGEFRTEGGGLDTVVSEGLHGVADRFSARFARRGEAAGAVAVPLRVDGVERFEDYVRLTRYLASIDIVERIRVVRLEGSRVHFQLRAAGGLSALAELIALGPTLVPDEGERNGDGEPVIRYRLR